MHSTRLSLARALVVYAGSASDVEALDGVPVCEGAIAAAVEDARHNLAKFDGRRPSPSQPCYGLTDACDKPSQATSPITLVVVSNSSIYSGL